MATEETDTTDTIETQSVDTASNDMLGDAELEKLVSGYLKAEEQADRELMAAFRAGTQLRLIGPADLYDPIDRTLVRAPSSAILVIAAHEGHVMIGQLSDNSHSIAVLYEEAHRWYRRKYFLPLSVLVNRERVEILEAPLATDSGRAVKGLDADGHASDIAVAVKKVEGLDMRDESSLLPRGTTLILRHGARAKDPKTSEVVNLPMNAEVMVVAALGDFVSGGDELEASIEELPPESGSETPKPEEREDRLPPDVIRVDFHGRVLDLSIDILGKLSPDTDILTWRELEKRQIALESRRRFLRFAFAGGVAAAAVASNIPWFLSRADKHGANRAPPTPLPEGSDAASNELLRFLDDEANTKALRETLRFIVPEVAVIYGLASAGGKYWFDVRGAVMDLERQGSLAAVKRMVELSTPLSEQMTRIWGTYRECYYKRVHVGWTETRHYKTDSKGRRSYSHSTWSKDYRSMWLEPGVLNGFNGELSTWFGHSTSYLNGSNELATAPLYDLLSADPNNAEGTFRLARIDLDNRRDMAMSAVWMALAAGVPMAIDAGVVESWRLTREYDDVPFQRELSTGISLSLGILLAHRYRKKLARTLEQNKYDLGALIDREVKRVRTLDIEAAFAEFYAGRTWSDWPHDVTHWSVRIAPLAYLATDHTYIHGSGFDQGRSLDPCYVSGSAVRAIASKVAALLEQAQRPVAAFVARPENAEALLPALRNGIGTRLIKKQVQADESEATSANRDRALWFSLPVWGLGLIDYALRS
jgi:hypothetical protein